MAYFYTEGDKKGQYNGRVLVNNSLYPLRLTGIDPAVDGRLSDVFG